MWVREVSANHPKAVFRVVSALPADGYGIGIAEIDGEGYEDMVKEIPEQETVSKTEVL
jgi:hypothetical protein